MAGTPMFTDAKRERAIAWKRWTRTLPDVAPAPGGLCRTGRVSSGRPVRLLPAAGARSPLAAAGGAGAGAADFLVQPAPEPRLAHLPQPGQFDRLDDWLTPTP